jgi:hypothetical protein
MSIMGDSAPTISSAGRSARSLAAASRATPGPPSEEEHPPALVRRPAPASGWTRSEPDTFSGTGWPARRSAHRALVTGVAPVRRGILQNKPFDPPGRNADGWY